MVERRWQPPPMHPAPGQGSTTAGPQVTVDEKVVRKMLQVNPVMRQGRTTFQVKKAIEAGGALTGGSAKESTVPPAREEGAPKAAGELAETLGFFLRGKSDSLVATLADIGARRRALDVEEENARQAVREQVVGFVTLLDAAVVDKHGPAALALFADVLRQIDLSPSQLIEAVRRARK